MSLIQQPTVKTWIALCAAALFLGLQPLASAVTITRTSASHIEIDPSGDDASSDDDAPTGHFSNYAAYQIRNDGAAPYADLWVKASGFQGVTSLSGSDPGQFQIGSLAAGETKTAFFYVRASEEKETPAAHSVQVYNGRPEVGTLLSSTVFALTSAEIGHGDNNKIIRATFSPANPAPGDVITVTVDGETGVLKPGDAMIFSPAVNESWNAQAFRLTSSVITVTNGTSTYSYADILSLGQPGSIKAVSYHAVYTFKASATTTSPTQLKTAGFFGTGGVRSREHGATLELGLPTIRSRANTTTLASLASASELYVNEPLTYTIRFTNTGSSEARIDSVVDTLPAGFSLVSGSSTFSDSSIPNPSTSGTTLTWSQGYTIPAASSRDLTFRALPATRGLAVNSVIAYSGAQLIDTTLLATDAQPGTSTVNVLAQPTASDDSISTLEDTTFSAAAPGVLANDVEPNGYSLVVTHYTQPAHGSVSVDANGAYSYSPAPDYNGSDSFTYTVGNGHAASATATVHISVASVNDSPTLEPIGNLSITAVAGPQIVTLSGLSPGPTAESDESLVVTATSSDPSIVPNPTVHFSSPDASGNLILQPEGHALGTATITVSVRDSGGALNGGIDTITRNFLVTVVPGPASASQSSVGTTSPSVTADGTSTATCTVTLRDANGNRIPGAPVGLAKTYGPGSPTILPTPATPATTDANGESVFTITSTTAGVDVFTATSLREPAVIDPTATVTFTPGAPAQLTFGVQPSSAVAGQAIHPAVTIEIRDAFGNLVTDSTAAITLRSSTTALTGGPFSVNAVAGVATFSDIVPLNAGTSQSLLADAASLPTTTSLAFSIAKASPVITGVSSQTQTYGTPGVTLTGNVSAPGPVHPADGETVTVTILGVSQPATISGGLGNFSLVFPTATLPYSATPYTVTYAYSGDSNLNAPADDTSTHLQVTRTDLIITAASAAKTYGSTHSATGPGQTSFSADKLMNGESIGSVTLTTAGAPANAAAGNYPITPSLATGGSFDPSNYSITYHPGTLTVNAAPLDLAGTAPYNGTTTFDASALVVVNNLDAANLSLSGSVEIDSRNTGDRSVVSTENLVLGGSAAGNYTLAGFTSSVTLTKTNITVTAAPNTKVYDATLQADATPTVTAGSLQPGDSAAFTEAYLSPHVGIDMTLVPSGTIEDGNGGENYACTFASSHDGVINPRPVSVTGLNAVNLRKFYDGTAALHFSGRPTLIPADIINGDDLYLASYDLSTARFADFNVDDVVALIFETGFVLGGSDAHNYYVVAQFPAASAILNTKTDAEITTITHSNPRSFDLHLLDGMVIASNNPDDGSINGDGTIYVTGSAVLSGNGRVGSMVIGAGGILSPGSSPGTLSAGTTVWGAEGTYSWEINDARGTAGATRGWDLTLVDGDLDIQATATEEGHFTIDVQTLTVLDEDGVAENFDNTHIYAWPIVTVTGSILNFAANKFDVEPTHFQNLWSGAGTFSIVEYGKSLYIVYTPTASVTLTPGVVYLRTGEVITGVRMSYTNLTGLVRIGGTTLVNVTVGGIAYNEAGVSIQSGLPVDLVLPTQLPPGTAIVEIEATKVTAGQSSRVNTFVVNTQEEVTAADPIIARLTADASGMARQVLDNVPAAEHYCRLANGSPGFHRVEFVVNGRTVFAQTVREDGAIEGDLAAFMDQGDSNVVTVTGYGAPGASAELVLADTYEGTLLNAPTVPRLSLSHNLAGRSLLVSWPDSAGDWILQHSVSASGNWTDVALPSTSADGLRTAALATDQPCGFFRLRHVSTASQTASRALANKAKATRSTHDTSF